MDSIPRISSLSLPRYEPKNQDNLFHQTLSLSTSNTELSINNQTIIKMYKHKCEEYCILKKEIEDKDSELFELKDSNLEKTLEIGELKQRCADIESMNEQLEQDLNERGDSEFDVMSSIKYCDLVEKIQKKEAENINLNEDIKKIVDVVNRRFITKEEHGLILYKLQTENYNLCYQNNFIHEKYEELKKSIQIQLPTSPQYDSSFLFCQESTNNSIFTETITSSDTKDDSINSIWESVGIDSPVSMNNSNSSTSNITSNSYVNNDQVVKYSNDTESDKIKPKKNKKKNNKKHTLDYSDSESEDVVKTPYLKIIKPSDEIIKIVNQLQSKFPAVEFDKRLNILTFGGEIKVSIQVTDVNGKFLTCKNHNITTSFTTENTIDYQMGSFNCNIHLDEAKKIIDAIDPVIDKNSVIDKILYSKPKSSKKYTEDNNVHEKKYKFICESGKHIRFMTKSEIKKVYDSSRTGAILKKARGGRDHEKRVIHNKDFCCFCLDCLEAKQRIIKFNDNFVCGHRNLSKEEFEDL